MIALGLLARDPELRKRVLGEQDPAPKLGRCRVVGFNRSTEASGGIWGSIAEQLGNPEQFARYISPLLRAPGPEAWKQLLGEDPLVIFLDELPTYLADAVTVPVGSGDLSIVTTTALANLFVAVSEMKNVCIVLSDLAGSNYSTGQASLDAALNRAVHEITGEARQLRSQLRRLIRTATNFITFCVNASSSRLRQRRRSGMWLPLIVKRFARQTG